MIHTRIFALVLLAACAFAHAEDKKEIRIGMIGLDTSHATNLTTIFNTDKPDKSPELAGFRVTVAYPVGSPDMQKESMDRVPGYVKQMKEMGVLDIQHLHVPFKPFLYVSPDPIVGPYDDDPAPRAVDR